ncbi:MAG: LemA family protein [Minisyncoccota bacterium]
MQEKNFIQRNLGWVIAIGIVAIVIIWGVSKYNMFVSSNIGVDTQWAQVENQLQRRFDLIPNLVATVKGVAGQEQEVFGAIAEARTRYSSAITPDARAAAAGQVESSLGRLLAIVENYPVLQSSQAFRDLMVQLEGTENRIAVERKNYNDKVSTFNVLVKRFPDMIFAKLFGYSERSFFEVSPEAQQNPTVNFEN